MIRPRTKRNSGIRPEVDFSLSRGSGSAASNSSVAVVIACQCNRPLDCLLRAPAVSARTASSYTDAVRRFAFLALVLAVFAPASARANGAFPDSFSFLVSPEHPDRLVLAPNFELALIDD